MPKPSATTPFHLTEATRTSTTDRTRPAPPSAPKHPDAETIELDATNADHYAFDEAVSPSLLSERSIVIVSNPAKRRRQTRRTMVAYCKQAVNNPAEASIVICQHEGGDKGKRLIDQLTKVRSRQRKPYDPKSRSRNSTSTIQCFERRNR